MYVALILKLLFNSRMISDIHHFFKKINTTNTRNRKIFHVGHYSPLRAPPVPNHSARAGGGGIGHSWGPEGAADGAAGERGGLHDACVVKWHAEVEAGGRKRLIELIDEDAEASLSSIGISHLSEVHLDGPITQDCSDGVGQALAVLGAQMHRIDNGLGRIATLLETLVAQNSSHQSLLSTMVDNQHSFNMAQLTYNRLILLPSEAYLARQALAAEEGLAYGQLKVTERAEEGYRRLLAEAIAGFKKLSTEAHLRPFQFTIDRTMPHKSFTISDDGTTATKVSNGNATFRSSKPLTAANHKWAVRIVDDVGNPYNIAVGLLPKLSDAQVARMDCGFGYIGSSALGGWGTGGDGRKHGNWECPPFRFAKGDVVVCDLSFAAKTLTLTGRLLALFLQSRRGMSCTLLCLSIIKGNR